MLSAESTWIYYLSQSQKHVVKVSSKTFSSLLLPIESAGPFQLSVQSNRIYLVSEDGWLEVIYLKKHGLHQKTNPKGPDDSDEEEDDDAESVASDYESRRIRIEPHVEEIAALDSSMMEKSIGEEAGGEQDELSVPKESSINGPVTFYRTLETNDKYAAVVSHDGRGNNVIHLYTRALELVTTKKVVIKKQDHSFSLSRRAVTETRTCTSCSYSSATRGC